MPNRSVPDEDLSVPIGKGGSVSNRSVPSMDSTVGCDDGRAVEARGASLRALKGASKMKIHGLIMPSPGDEAGGSENVPRRDISGGESRVSSVGRMPKPPKSVEIESQ